MANNGKITAQATAYHTLELEWIQEQDVAKNQSHIVWRLRLIASGTWSYIDSSAKKTYQVNIGGNWFEGTDYIGTDANTTKELAIGETYIPHNSDGTKTIYIGFTQEMDIVWSGKVVDSIGNSATVVLDPIPRGATITSAPNFTDGENPTITYSNPAGSRVTGLQACISIVGGSGGDDIPYRDVPVNGNSYTFNLTDKERETLINAVKTGNSVQVRFYIWTNINGTSYYDYTTKTFSINDVNPIIYLAEAVDTSDEAIALSGNSNYWVKGLSNVQYNIGASAQAGAYITSYSVKCGSTTLTTDSGTFENVSDNKIIVTVTDTRGNTATKEITPAKWINYNGLTCTIVYGKLEANDTLDFNVSGVYYNGSFGAATNDLTLSYRYKMEGLANFGAWQPLTADISTNSYKASATINDTSYMFNYVIQVRAMDRAQTVLTDEYTVHMARSVFDWGENDFNFNVTTSMPILTLKKGGAIIQTYPDGATRTMIEAGYNNYLRIGSGGRAASVGGTILEGNGVTITSNHDLYIGAPDGVCINGCFLRGYVVEEGEHSNTGSYFQYRVWSSGVIEIWGKCTATYRASHYLGVYCAFPKTLNEWTSAMGTLNSYSGNLATYLTTNPKVECQNSGCNVWVQNSNNSFVSGDTATVSLHILGKVDKPGAMG